MRYLFLLTIALVFFSCYESADFAPSDGNGMGSSTARFTIVGDFMYIVDHSFITTLDISDEKNPIEINKQEVGFGIETIFPYEDFLFIGSSLGMYIYQISSDGIPVQQSSLEHFQSCDPVVANDRYAFVTLKSGGDCRIGTAFFSNILEIVNIENINNPILVNQYEMHYPGGLGLSGDILFVADSYEGVKVFDVSNPVDDLKLLTVIPGSYDALDLIPLNGLLIVISPENMYQYDYSDLDNIKLLSTISIKS